MEPPVTQQVDENQLVEFGFKSLLARNFEVAAEAAERALKANRSFSDAWVLLCSALIQLGSADDLRALEDALEAIKPDDDARLPLTVELARACARRGQAFRAVELADSVSTDPGLTPANHDALGTTYTLAGLFEKSLAYSQKAVDASPSNPLYLYSHALTLRYLGRLAEAEVALDTVIRRQPDHCLSYFTRADLKKWSASNNHINALQSLLKNGKFKPQEERQLQFALFKELHDCRRFDEAWIALERGNESMRQECPYPRESKKLAALASLETFNGILPNAAATVTEGPMPIFIIGLPRSGTTLVERILSQHPLVQAMGETQGIPLALRESLELRLHEDISSEAVKRCVGLNWSNLRDTYLKNIGHLSGSKRFCTDKLPHNYEFVGQILQAFPEAKIVNLQRNPMDSLFGAYKILFGTNSYLWSYGQNELAEAYHLYRMLTEGWRARFPENFVDVSLEGLVADPEVSIRKLLSNLGLEFHQECLFPEKAQSGVSTASSVQVRSPINSSGIGVWKAYEDKLNVLHNHLERLGYVDLKS
jgi:tetratricopeptide (TPR) repeat protein